MVLEGTVEDYSVLPIMMHHVVNEPRLCGLVFLLWSYIGNVAFRFKLSNFRAKGSSLLRILGQFSFNVSETGEHSLFACIKQGDRRSTPL